jgi:hypothetical protein
MSRPTAQQSKTYFIQRDGAELGPFTVAQLNQMRSRNEIAGGDLCRSTDSTELRPLGSVFPHMADFVRKSSEEHKQFARTIEGNWQANASLGCAIASIFIATPVLAVFAMVLGIRSTLRVTNWKALAGTILGAITFMLFLFNYLRPYLRL